MSDASRLAALEAENDALRQRLLAAGLPFRPLGVPSGEDALALFEIINAAHPKLRVPYAEFCRALIFAVHARRVPLPNAGYSMSFWVDQARDYLRRRGIEGSVTIYSSVFAACVVCGVAYTDPARWPYCSIGLGLGDVRKPDETWRTILAAGKLPPPSNPKTKQAVNVVQLDMLRTLGGPRSSMT